jgi:hypothetical protein
MTSFNYRDHITTGSLQDAMNWINASSLSVQDKQVLTRFVNRFPNMIFYKEDDAALDQVEQNENVTLPAEIRNIRKTVAYVNPDERIVFQVERFDKWSPRQDAVKEIWYRFGMIGYSDDEERELLDPEKLFPIAEAWRTGRSSLAIKLDHADTNIYEYNQQDLWDNVSEEKPISASIRSVFSSYTILIDSITALQRMNGDIIQAV